jgi:predicted nucleotidyltransferase
MTRDQVITRLKAHAGEIRRRGVQHLSLFGSTARGEARPDSDVDVLIDVPADHKFSLIDLADLRVRLREITGVETDVIVRDDLRPERRAQIAKEAVEVF